MNRRRFAVVGALAALYFALPSGGVLTGGLPLGPGGTIVVAGILLSIFCFGRAAVAPRWFGRSTVALLMLIALRIAVAAVAVQPGWLASYYANETRTGSPQWSSDFRLRDATRIDRAVDFHDDTFPAFYLNDHTFDRGSRREVTEPMSIEWKGFTTVPTSRRADFTLTARGEAAALVDGRIVAVALAPKTRATTQQTVTLEAGAHELIVRYAKPSETDGLIAFSATTTDPAGAGTPLRIWPRSISAEPARWPLAVGRVLDIAALIVGLVALTAALAGSLPQPTRVAAAAVLAVFALQGIWQARHFVGRVVTLSQGDDWFGFESRARDILQHGPLMTLGEPVGHGLPYFYHPLYCYFVAAAHAIAGETLFGPVFLQFLILGVVTIMMWRFAADLFGSRAATVGAAALVVFFQLDFARYYTITLLSENIYILTVTLMLVRFVRWARAGERRDLVVAAIWGGVSSITRPAMMMYFVPALALVALLSLMRTRRVAAAAMATALAATVWGATIAPVTVRNWVVARRFVLISEGFSGAFITYNLPASADPKVYSDPTAGPARGLLTLARIARDYPREFLGIQLRKIGFSLGMVQWAGGYRPHPELVAVTLLYVAMLVASPRMRSRELWPVHVFVASHVLSMGLTLPWNYGYRLILPPFVYMTALAAAAAWQMVARYRVAGTGQSVRLGA